MRFCVLREGKNSRTQKGEGLTMFLCPRAGKDQFEVRGKRKIESVQRKGRKGFHICVDQKDKRLIVERWGSK